MEETTSDRPWIALQELLDRRSGDEVRRVLEELGPADAARCVARLDPAYRDQILQVLDAESAADLIEQLSNAQGSELLRGAEPETAAAILSELPSADQADLITALEPEDAASILAEMDPESARDAEELASYPPDTAGGLMVTEVLAYQASSTVEELVADLRRRVDEVADWEVQYIYVVGPHRELEGVLPLRDLLLARGRRLLSEVMIANPRAVPLEMGLDELADFFDQCGFLGVPVVGRQGRLRGVVHRSAVRRAWGDRAESDNLKARGIVGGEELRSMRLVTRCRRRLSWLSVNILLNILAASVIAAYEDTLSTVIALAVFLPIISDMSGCSGNQAVAVSMRELTLGIVKPVDVLHVLRKELLVGLVNGLALGVLLGLAAWVWKGIPALGLVVGAALAVNTVIAVSIGGGIPLLLRRLKMDPALASGPILTTLTDMCGFLLVLSLATTCLDALR